MLRRNIISQTEKRLSTKCIRKMHFCIPPEKWMHFILHLRMRTKWTQISKAEINKMHFLEKCIRACALKLNFENRNKIFVKFISKLQESAVTKANTFHHQQSAVVKSKTYLVWLSCWKQKCRILQKLLKRLFLLGNSQDSRLSITPMN